MNGALSFFDLHKAPLYLSPCSFSSGALRKTEGRKKEPPSPFFHSEAKKKEKKGEEKEEKAPRREEKQRAKEGWSECMTGTAWGAFIPFFLCARRAGVNLFPNSISTYAP